MQVNIAGPGLKELEKLTRRLEDSASKKAIRDELMAALKESTKPIVGDVKTAALALPSKGRHHTGLRRRIARAVGAQIGTTGVKVQISRRVMGNQASLPKRIDEGKWRHPVFGNSDVWVTQQGQRAWFENAVKRHTRGVQQAVKGVLDDLEKKLKV